MSRKKVLFISSEMNPFLEGSSVAEIARQLPQAIQEKDNEIQSLPHVISSQEIKIKDLNTVKQNVQYSNK